jgi:hypothetical protein
MMMSTKSGTSEDGVLKLARELRHGYDVGVKHMQDAMEAYDHAVGDRRQAAVEFLRSFITAKANFDSAETKALGRYRAWFEGKYG